MSNKWEKISGENQASSANVGLFKSAASDTSPVTPAVLAEALSKAAGDVSQLAGTMDRFPQKPEIVQARELVNSLMKALTPEQQLDKTAENEDTAEQQAASTISVKG